MDIFFLHFCSGFFILSGIGTSERNIENSVRTTLEFSARYKTIRFSA
jgi:hypothetical protein